MKDIDRDTHTHERKHRSVNNLLVQFFFCLSLPFPVKLINSPDKSIEQKCTRGECVNMQAKKRYILVFVSCAFLAYCYFGGYRLKRARGITSFSSTANVHHQRHERIVMPPNLPSFLSPIECNGIIINSDFSHGNGDTRNTNHNNDIDEYVNGKGIAIAQPNHFNSNDDAFRQGSQVSSATVQTNAKFKGMYIKIDKLFSTTSM